ncbi:MAG: hypothetical protein KTR21_12690 [Rhodobacteraceae bacterium]|nr:hypothetical protein [Paracoccaceae bacterium]
MRKALLRSVGVRLSVAAIVGVAAVNLTSCGKTATVFEDLQLLDPAQRQPTPEPASSTAPPEPSPTEPPEIAALEPSDAADSEADGFENISLFDFLKEKLALDLAPGGELSAAPNPEQPEGLKRERAVSAVAGPPEAENSEADVFEEISLFDFFREKLALDPAPIEEPSETLSPEPPEDVKVAEAADAAQPPEILSEATAAPSTKEQPADAAVELPEALSPEQSEDLGDERVDVVSVEQPDIVSADLSEASSAELSQTSNDPRSGAELRTASLGASPSRPRPLGRTQPPSPAPVQGQPEPIQNQADQVQIILDEQLRYDGGLFQPGNCAAPTENAFWAMIGGERFAIPMDTMAGVRPLSADSFLSRNSAAPVAGVIANDLNSGSGCPGNAPKISQAWLTEGSLGEQSLLGVRIQVAPQPDHAERLQRDVTRLQSHPSCDVNGDVRSCLSQERSSQGVKQLFYITRQLDSVGGDDGPPIFIRCEEPGESACEIYHPLSSMARLVAFVSFNGEYLPAEGAELAPLVAELQRIEVQIMSWRR